VITNSRTYIQKLTEQLWSYRAAAFASDDALFDPQVSRLPNAPVFRTEASDRNVIVPADAELTTAILGFVPPKKRHRWFRSMKSSQALALSVFGNLKVSNRTRCLSEVRADDDDIPAFSHEPIEPSTLQLEHDVDSLNEVRRTNVDVLVSGPAFICVECKLSEQEVALPSGDPVPARPEPAGGVSRRGARQARTRARASDLRRQESRVPAGRTRDVRDAASTTA
jgi:hypothetical protein